MATIQPMRISDLTNRNDSPALTDKFVLEATGNVFYSITALDLLKTYIMTWTGSSSQAMLKAHQMIVFSQNASDVIATFTEVSVGAVLYAQALTVYGAGSGHQIVLPVGCTWDGTNRKAVFNAVGDSLIAVVYSATRVMVFANNSVTFTN